MKKFIFMVPVLCILIMGCSASISFEGSIIEVIPADKQILVEDVQGDQILFRIKNSSMENFQIGQQVIVWYNGSIKESLPPQAAAEKVTIKHK